MPGQAGVGLQFLGSVRATAAHQAVLRAVEGRRMAPNDVALGEQHALTVPGRGEQDKRPETTNAPHDGGACSPDRSTDGR